MSIIVKHRTDIDLVAERVGVQARAATAATGAAAAARPRLALRGLSRRRPARAGARSCSPSARSSAREGVAVGTSEILDAFAALGRGALDRPATTSARRWRRRSPSPRRTAAIFELLFDRFFFRAAEAEALERGIGEDAALRGRRAASTSTSCARQIRQAIADGQRRRDARPGAARDRRLRPPGRGLRRDRRRRAADPPHARPRRPAAAERRRRRAGRRSTASSSTASSATCAASSSGRLIERTGKLPPSRPLAELDRALPTSPAQDLAAVHRAVAQLKRRLATLGHEQRGRSAGPRRRRAPDDARLARDRRRAAAPALPAEAPAPARDLRALRRLDLGHARASVFFLSVLHALHDSFRKLRSFVFIERISEVTDIFEHERDFRTISRADLHARAASPTSPATPTTAGSGSSSSSEISDDLDPRSTVIVLGDARTNGREPHAEVFAPDRRAGRPHLLAQPRAEALLELRRLGDGRLRALLRRRLRVLDDQAPRELRQRRSPAPSESPTSASPSSGAAAPGGPRPGRDARASAD